MSKADRLRYRESQMTHAMTFTGVHIEEGLPVRWRVENSWVRRRRGNKIALLTTIFSLGRFIWKKGLHCHDGRLVFGIHISGGCGQVHSTTPSQSSARQQRRNSEARPMGVSSRKPDQVKIMFNPQPFHPPKLASPMGALA